MTSQPRDILVTSALYANAPLHLGHMLEQVQTDIWVSSRSPGDITACPSAPMMPWHRILSAEQAGHAEITWYRAGGPPPGFHGLLIAFDNYYSTIRGKSTLVRGDILPWRRRPRRSAGDSPGL